MSLTTTTTLRVMSSMPVLAGTGMLCMGLGIIPLDQGLVDVGTAVLGSTPPRPFFIFLGCSKIMGVLGLWNKGIFRRSGPTRRLLSFSALGIPATCAIYGHMKVGDGNAPFAAIYLIILSTLFILDNNNNNNNNNNSNLSSSPSSSKKQK